MRRRLALLIASLALAAGTLATVSPASAVIQYPNTCNGPYVEFFGNNNYEPWFNRLKICWSGGIWELRFIQDSYSGNCQGFLGIDRGHWEDCITSLKVENVSGTNKHLCVYNGRGATKGEGWLDYQSDTWTSDLGWDWDDKFSSVRWRYDWEAC